MKKAFKIERDVPVAQHKREGRWAELACAMNPGDSVAVPTRQDAAGLWLALRRYNKRAITRKEGNGYRVWRIYSEKERAVGKK